MLFLFKQHFLRLQRDLLRLIICVMVTSGLLTLSACSPKPDYFTADGQSGRFADHQGKWLVINYWAIWCKPCREEIPELNTFQLQHRDNVIVMGVDFDQNSSDKLQPLIKELGIQFTVLTQDPAPIFGWGRAAGLPTTYIINPQGQLSATLNGPQTLDSLNRATVEAIGESP
jgi:thiol-disulfide isomerase/thioredoxin